MRFYSTPESAERGEVSVLAIAETVMAIGLTIWLAVRYQTVRHIAIGGCIAPFLLLRTESSTKLALSWFETDGLALRKLEPLVKPLFLRLYSSEEERARSPISGVSLFVFICVLPISLSVACLLARIAATVIAIKRDFTDAFRAVASNWRRISLATDICCPPEILPGIETGNCPSALSQFRLTFFRSKLSSSSSNRERAAVAILMVPVAIFLYMPSLFYRLSVKSTCLLSMPFLFVIRSHLGEDLPAKDRIHDLKFGATEQLQWWYAWIVLIVHSASLLTLSVNFAVLNFELHPDSLIAAFLLDQFLPTDGQQLRLKAWHIARFANAAIFVWLFFFADRAERRLNSGRWTDDQITATFDRVRRVQVVLALYTTLCALIRIIQFADSAKLPSVGFEFLP